MMKTALYDDTDAELFERLLPAVVEAGEAILRIRGSGNKVETKADHSPVTAADRAAEAILLRALHDLCPGVPIVAEEEVAAGRAPEVTTTYFAVDALDGTKDFLRGGPDFTVNVGLVRDGRAVAGIVGAPATGTLWLGLDGRGAFRIEAGGERIPIRVRVPDPEALDIIASRSHRTAETDAFIARFPGAHIVAAGSSLKLTAVAEGRADLYPRLAPTSQWDIAAGHAVLAAAGGRVLDLDGDELRYERRPRPDGHPFLNPWFVATGGLDPFAAPA
ncbi:MAG: 3'(2'),5'-bisphosphate nucleotidase CysQ [Bauldia sp.]